MQYYFKMVKTKLDRLLKFIDRINKLYEGEPIPKKDFLLGIQANIGSQKRTLKETIEVLNSFDLVDENKEEGTVVINKKNVIRARQFKGL